MKQQLQSLLIQNLPPEIRQEIYTHVLISDQPLTDLTLPDRLYSKARPDQRAPLLGLSLSQTCHFIHNELDIRPFYANNTFTFTRPNIVWIFFEHLRRTKQLHLLSSINFDLRHTITIDDLNDTGEFACRKVSSWVDWDHYLTCINSYDSRVGAEHTNPDRRRDETDTTCHLYDDMHFTDHTHLLTSLKNLTLDCVGLQVDVWNRTHSESETAKFPLQFLDWLRSDFVLPNSPASHLDAPFNANVNDHQGAMRPQIILRALNTDFERDHRGCIVPHEMRRNIPSLKASPSECLNLRDAAKRAHLSHVIERLSSGVAMIEYRDAVLADAMLEGA